VSKSALGVFRSMFLNRNSEEGSQKEVRWDSIVLAMAEREVGFVASHSSGGSAVQLEPNEGSKWFGMRKIGFHKPHPVPVIDHVMLLSMGKRMRSGFDGTKRRSCWKRRRSEPIGNGYADILAVHGGKEGRRIAVCVREVRR
jgi:hypothetical protein